MRPLETLALLNAGSCGFRPVAELRWVRPSGNWRDSRTNPDPLVEDHRRCQIIRVAPVVRVTQVGDIAGGTGRLLTARSRFSSAAGARAQPHQRRCPPAVKILAKILQMSV